MRFGCKTLTTNREYRRSSLARISGNTLGNFGAYCTLVPIKIRHWAPSGIWSYSSSPQKASGLTTVGLIKSVRIFRVHFFCGGESHSTTLSLNDSNWLETKATSTWGPEHEVKKSKPAGSSYASDRRPHTRRTGLSVVPNVSVWSRHSLIAPSMVLSFTCKHAKKILNAVKKAAYYRTTDQISSFFLHWLITALSFQTPTSLLLASSFKQTIRKNIFNIKTNNKWE